MKYKKTTLLPDIAYEKRNTILKRILYFAISVVLILFGVTTSYRMRWISDDAFISLRYAKNSADGKGLVFNEGEFVEGYTNFFWTILLIPFHLSNQIDPVGACYFFGILSFFGTCIYLILFCKKLSPIPFALSCFVLLYHNRIFATGGLETSLHGFILLSASYHLIYCRTTNFYKIIPGILLSSLSCLNRPDGILFHILAGIYIILKFLQESKSNHTNLRFDFSLVILCITYLLPVFYYIWKLEYYGNILPNTFYAKSGGSPRLTQGLIYLWVFFKNVLRYDTDFRICSCSFFWTIRKQWIHKNIEKDFRWILLVLFPILYAGYYTWIGGDFMFSRFYLPILPLIFVWTEQEILYLIQSHSKHKKTAYLILYSIPILILLRWDIYKGLSLPVVSGIADENQVYKRESMERIRNEILPWRKHFEKSKVRVAFAGSECFLIYYLNPILAIETETGLTDPIIARTEFKDLERVGHGKSIPLQYLKERNIHLILYSNGLPEKTEYNEFLTGNFSTPWRILTYSPSVMKELLKIPSFHAVDFESYLDTYRYEYRKLNVTQRKEKFSEFDSYYFKNGEDKNRREWYQNNL
ncbi:putative membrane protein [Leptospira interrogans serovar Bataviae str. UI 08561]|nr:putative membrane protein [Leptospira interrogans serovar Bataviae str. UI 08561]